MNTGGGWRRPLVLGVLALLCLAVVSGCGCSGDQEPMVELPNPELSPTRTADGTPSTPA